MRKQINMNDVLGFIVKYYKFFYPGYISVCFYYFIQGKSAKKDSNILIKSIGISYLYISCLNYKGYTCSNKLLIIIAFSAPYIFDKLIKVSWISNILRIIGIRTTLFNEPLDLIQEEVRKKTSITKKILTILLKKIKECINSSSYYIYFKRKGILKVLKKFVNWIKRNIRMLIELKNKCYEPRSTVMNIYLLNSKIMYRGFLNYHQSDSDEDRVICLKNYEIYKIRDDNSLKLVNKKDNYVIIRENNIERIEVDDIIGKNISI